MGWDVITTTDPVRDAIKAEFGDRYGYMRLANTTRGTCYVLAQPIGRSTYGLWVVLYEQAPGRVLMKVMSECEHPFYYGATPGMIDSADCIGDLYDCDWHREQAEQWRTLCMAKATECKNADLL